ncbi:MULTISPECIES: IclR family transcriptional regulator C-terminal domain-containing protein [unclassified Streptomyces]|uniref:IclR family transcriptional regulator domain-containing protein n=1 Tax=unclassified Streptomyces TaxID=2593676 RepID=UPI0022514FDD|nr:MULTISPECIES: IclR family transcriptional regulator C-terminal domain-containing protein [unclassified Streptomyces]MCX4990307.1 helix-turn-helix domain-containing protein [Streptomyces sp. NBC_00568]MCX5004462.1 helix-turn-helix domain-containing protein [Streptomyces sp. NBC_00638]
MSARASAGAEVPDEAVTPLIRGIAVLRRLTEADGASSLSGLERATGLARSTVDRITATLARMGYVRLDGRDAILAPRLMELGNAYLAALRLPRLLDAYADALADELDESVSLAVGDQDGIRFIHQATRRRAMSLSFRIGDLLPAERTAPGALFASEWSEEEWARWRERRATDPEDRGFPAVPARSRPYDGRTETTAFPAGQLPTVGDDFEQRAAEARRTGWALDDQLIEPGLVAVSMPVREAGRIACVVNVVSHTSRHSATDLRDVLLPRLRMAVAEMERVLTLEAEPAPERRASERTAAEREASTQAAPEQSALAAERYARADAGDATTPSGLADWTGASKHELGREFIESLARGLTVITAFGEGRAELTLTAVAQATGLARATARRALITLEHLGYVSTHDRFFRLTPRVLSLGFPPLSRTSLPEIATPHMTELSQRLHDSVSLAVLAGDEIQYTGRVSTRRIMSVNVTVGTRLPAYATSLGRVILADLPETRGTEGLEDGLLGRPGEPVAPSVHPSGEPSVGPWGGLSAALPEQLSPLTPRTITDPERFRAELDRVRKAGYAMVEEELEQGLRSIAVPVRDRGGRVVAALNVAMHSSRRTAEECVRDVLPDLHATATRIEADLRVAGRFRLVQLT